ncbi:hypothetical protein SFRURICE_020956 [Spodoptera frugiperda]|nr:hypothetical protein SFRURICE_020956 [Spodoptera frugiperda]
MYMTPIPETIICGTNKELFGACRHVRLLVSIEYTPVAFVQKDRFLKLTMLVLLYIRIEGRKRIDRA